MPELLKKLLILGQVVLALTLPLFVRVAPTREAPSTQLTAYAIHLIQDQCRRPPEATHPSVDQAFLIREFQAYCRDHQLPKGTGIESEI